MQSATGTTQVVDAPQGAGSALGTRSGGAADAATWAESQKETTLSTADNEFDARSAGGSAGGAECVAAGFHSHSTEPEMGFGHHICVDGAELDVSVCGD